MSRVTTKSIAVTPGTLRRLHKLATYEETMDNVINRLVDHFDKTTARNSKGQFTKGGKKIWLELPQNRLP